MGRAGLSVEEVGAPEGFEALGPAWEALFERSEGGSPFLSHGWFRCCWAAYGTGRRLVVLAVRDGGSVVGLAPLWAYAESINGLPVRVMGFITAPDTPSVDLLALPDRADEVADAVVDHLLGPGRDDWDALSLSQWPVASPARARLLAAARRRRRAVAESVSSVSPYIAVEGDWAAFLGTRSVRFRKTHRNVVNRVRKLQGLEVECFRGGVVPPSLFDDVLTVSSRSWKHAQGLALSSRAESTAFFRRLTEYGQRRGWLMVWLLRVHGVPIAMEYDLEHQGRVHALRADFDEAYREYSPGTYLEYEIVRRLFELGYREYNTGPGLNAYKLRWTEDARENRRVTLYNDTLRGRILSTVQARLLPGLRRLKRAALRQV